MAKRPTSTPLLLPLEPRHLLAAAPFVNPPPNLPTTIQTENYDTGGPAVAYADLTPPNDGAAYRPAESVDLQSTAAANQYTLAFTKAGEWTQYTINVPTAGTYRFDLRVGSRRGGGQLHLSVGALNTARLTLPNTGDWQTYQTVSAGTLTLPAGRQTLRLVFDANDPTGFVGNVDWISATAAPVSLPGQAPFNNTPANAPGTTQAENFDTGGQSVAYNDTTPANEGAAYRTNERVDLQPTTDAGGGHNVGFVKAGEWLEYTTDVAAAGNYDLTLRAASPVDGGAFRVEVDGRNVTGTLRVGATGGWQTYADVIARNIPLTAGRHVVRVVAETNNRYGYAPNLNHFTWRAAQPASAASLRVSPDGRYLTKPDGSPFYWVADTGWRMFNVLTTADADFYLTDRASKGFTVIRTVLIDDPTPTNAYGQPPLLNNDPTRPNDAYFRTVDTMVNRAQALGLHLAIAPTWGDKVAGPDPIFKTTAQAHAYGQFLGARYKGKNIVWIVNADWSPAGFVPIWQAMADGLIAGSARTHLITSQPQARASSSTWFHNDPRFDFNTFASDHTRDADAAYTLPAADWNRGPAKPTQDGEPNYEDIPNNLRDGQTLLTDYDVRKKNYWSYLAGGFGVTYGQMNVYQFWQPGRSPDFPGSANITWRDALNRPGALQIKHLRRLMGLRPLALRTPDQSLLKSPALTGGDHVQAARASDGSYALIYTASGKPVTVDMTKLTGPTVKAHWYNPRTGTFQRIADHTNTGTATFTPPTPNTDWLLVLDDAKRGYATV